LLADYESMSHSSSQADIDALIAQAAAEAAGEATASPAVADEPVAEPHLPAPLADASLATVDLAPLDGGAVVTHESVADLEPVLDVPVELVVEIGRTSMTIRETLLLGSGSIVSLDKLAGEPVDLLVNGRRIARGEVVAVDEEFGLRVTEIVSPERRLDGASSL
jgi:flagellar motor switch protein FliN/FliY